MSNADDKGAVIIVGAGPGVSGALARLWADAGHPVGLLGTEEEQLGILADDLASRGVRVLAIAADVTDEPAARSALSRLAHELGPVDVLHFNPSRFRAADPLALTVPQLLEDVALGVGALLTALQAVRPSMRSGSRVSATGSMAADEPWSGAPSLGVQKAGLRNLVKSIDGALAPEGIRAVSVTVRGTLGTDGPFTPDRVGAAIFSATHQDPAAWVPEIDYVG
jgi:NAD(P)-dependent dehydrogenase (short-subunit alcohol dehydrogenase family)